MQAIRSGKTVPIRKPLRNPASVGLKLLKKGNKEPPFSTKPETMPVSAGPALAPISPAIAKRANIKVPPVGMREAPRLYVPGQRSAEARPAIKPHSRKASIAYWEQVGRKRQQGGFKGEINF